MKVKQILKYTLLIFVILFGCLLMYAFFSLARFDLVITPPERHNTLWECEEYDMYFVVDSRGRCLGEINVGEKHLYVDYSWNTITDYVAFIHGIDVTEDGIPLDTAKGIPYNKKYLGAKCKYWHNKAIVFNQPDQFYLWKIDEPVTMTFVCKGKVPEVDFLSGKDPIRRMEVIR